MKTKMTFKEWLAESDYSYLSESEAENLYRDVIDETEGAIKICGMSFTASRIVEELDPTAFRCGMTDYLDGDYEEFEDGYILKSELEKAQEEYQEYCEEIDEENETELNETEKE